MYKIYTIRKGQKYPPAGNIEQSLALPSSGLLNIHKPVGIFIDQQGQLKQKPAQLT
jgi:hypothetical protein